MDFAGYFREIATLEEAAKFSGQIAATGWYPPPPWRSDIRLTHLKSINGVQKGVKKCRILPQVSQFFAISGSSLSQFSDGF